MDFHIQICIVHNDVLCVATLTSQDMKRQPTQTMITRYFFAQFWCEFTKDVLTEFINEDFLIKEMQAEAAEKKKVQNLQNIQQQLLSNH